MPERMTDFTLTEIRNVGARLEPYEWPWARENASAIARNWKRRRVERPGMFDGHVMLCRSFDIRDGIGDAVFFETRYSCFIAFRDAGSPDAVVTNAFAALVPRTADGAVLLGRMAAHTANAGQIYFPCGTPDRDDLRPGGIVDLAGSAAREFREETGLDMPQSSVDEPWMVAQGEGQLAFLRPAHFPESAAELVARIADYHAGQSEPELAGMVVARSAADIDASRMPGFLRAFLKAAFPG